MSKYSKKYEEVALMLIARDANDTEINLCCTTMSMVRPEFDKVRFLNYLETQKERGTREA